MERDADRDTVRHLWSIRPEREGDCLTLTFHGSGFLYKMVRMLTGSLVRVAMGRASISWLKGLLADPAGIKTHHTAPPDGLSLVEVEYPG